jgi:hypothetical protein
MNALTSKGEPPAPPYDIWEERAKLLIQREMKEREISYRELSRMLKEFRIDESPAQINRKVTRKRFSAAFFVACMRAMGVETIPLK